MFSDLFIRRSIVALATCVAVLAPTLVSANSGAGGVPGSTKLTLINGWKNTPYGTSNAAVSALNGIVHLKGAILTAGTSANPFILPVPFRPAVGVYVPVDMCNATNGRLIVHPDGTVEVQAESDFANAQCFTSLDGATFALSPDGFHDLTLKNGWTVYDGITGIPAARKIGNVVHLAGAMETALENNMPFKLAKAFRPPHRVYAKLDLCAATTGGMTFDADGSVHVYPEGDFSEAQCFTSLDGVSYAVDTDGFTALTLINGWTNWSVTANAAAKAANGIVQLQGFIISQGTNTFPFVLPVGLRPAKRVYLPVEMCVTTNGRLIIDPDGTATLEAESDFDNARCGTSLEGVSFHQ